MKAHEFFPQIRPHSFRTIKWERAITELILGYFLKTVVGDNLQEYAAVIDAPIQHTPGYDLLAVLLCYTIQVFADFAGYSLVAIGLARLFGYELLPNFNFPFLSTSFKEFWTRWHISLSTWLREYLYFPLGGNKRGPLRTYFNLFIVMLLGGLWHGGTWNYAVWGGIHGSALAMERLCGNIPFRIQSRAFNALRGALVFATVAVALVFFRLPNIPSALRYLQTIYTNWIPVRTLVPFTALIFFALPVVVYHLLAYLREKYRWKLGPSFRPLILGLLLYLIVTNRGFPVTFIYFQF